MIHVALPVVGLAGFLGLLALAGSACTDTLEPLTGTQSLEVELLSPSTTGDVKNRLGETERTVIVNLRAKDANNAVDPSFSGDIRVYAQFLGTLTPTLEQQPLATIPMTGGVALNQTITLPPSVLSSTTLWFDNGTGLGPEYQFGAVTGTSPTLWYREPFIADLQRPRDETALDALSATPLQDKQIRVEASRHGDRGAMVVTSTFAQGYTVSDVQCATGGAMPTPPCTTPAVNGIVGYDHVLVFTFSSPRDQHGGPLQVGEVIQSFAGGLTEFNGLTEIGFPRTFIATPDRDTPPYVNPALLPAPVLFSTTWFDPVSRPDPLANPDGRINFERNEAGPIEMRNVKVCPLDDGPEGVYTRFKQWTIDPS
ncbi:MAG: hypothetical protein H0X17_03565, partial [Deltaproteobacteria bacterium]|nr:hypothetical protein [Deltaproteobacteria bacterium]